MEKLIELLNEYEKEKTNQDVRFWNYYQNWFHYLEDGQSYSELLMISKKYGFIKRLVDNDKIDKKKIDKAERRPMYVTDDMFSLYDLDECVIMLLSISDEPISDLISYLR